MKNTGFSQLWEVTWGHNSFDSFDCLRISQVFFSPPLFFLPFMLMLLLMLLNPTNIIVKKNMRTLQTWSKKHKRIFFVGQKRNKYTLHFLSSKYLIFSHTSYRNKPTIVQCFELCHLQIDIIQTINNFIHSFTVIKVNHSTSLHSFRAMIFNINACVPTCFQNLTKTQKAFKTKSGYGLSIKSWIFLGHQNNNSFGFLCKQNVW